LWLAAAATAIALVAFVAHFWLALSGGYLSYLSGIWLALARDLAAGTFYRDLIGPLGYGGTRYFPLFFVVIGGLLRLGLSPLAAGWIASLLSAIVQAVGLARVGRALGAPRSMVWLLAAGALAPYFVQQTLFELRADVLATGLSLLGIAAAIPVWREPADTRARVTTVAVWLTLAVATKITSLAIPASIIIAMVLAGRAHAAWRLSIRLVIGLLSFFVMVQVTSGGRALTSWRACMFAGAGEVSGLRALLAGDFMRAVTFSHLLAALFVLDVVALTALVVLGRRSDWLSGRSIWLPAALLVGVTASTAFTLSTPGTVPSNQVIDWIGISLVVLTWAAAGRRELTRAASVAIALVVIWMAGQDLVRVRSLWRDADSQAVRAAARSQVVHLVTDASAPVLAESALWPVLAGQQAILLDPFALRVVTSSHPEIAADLEAKLEAHYFSAVILDLDPTSERGRGWYEHLHFGWPIMARVLANYELDRQLAPDVWVYAPKGGRAR
jgi:hypothetical protein